MTALGSQPRETIQRYCKTLKKDVTIYKIRSNYARDRPRAFKSPSDVYMLACEHTFLEGVSECNLKCAYSIGNQVGVVAQMKMAHLKGKTISLNKDGTIPLHLLIQGDFKDYTR